MLLTLYYMAATWLQSWRLGSLKARLSQYLQSNSSIVLYKIPENVTADTESLGPSSSVCSNSSHAHVSEVLWHDGPMRMCSLVPLQRLSLSTWIATPGSPFLASAGSSLLSLASVASPTVAERSLSTDVTGRLKDLSPASSDGGYYLHLLLEASLKRSEELERIDLHRFGSLVAWRVDNMLGLVLDSTLQQLTELTQQFMTGNMALRGGMELLRIQTVMVEGSPFMLNEAPALQYIPTGTTIPDISSTQWNSHIDNLKQLSSKASDSLVNIDLSIAGDKNRSISKEISVSNNEAVKPENENLDNNIKESTRELIQAEEFQDHASVSEELIQNVEKKPLILNLNKSISSNKLNDEPKKSNIETKPVLENNLNEKRNSIKDNSPKKVSFKKDISGRPSRANNSKMNISKPPNVLVYADSAVARDNVKTTLKTILHEDKYTIYTLNKSQAVSPVWMDNALLVVVCGSVTEDVAPLLLDYLLGGGKLLCLCSDLIHTVLPTYKTAEVREHELVRFSYGKWQQVRMMHHIFCYQQSPARKNFSHDSEEPPITHAPPATPSSVEVRDSHGRVFKLNVRVLGAEETWHTPSLLLATTTENEKKGQAVFSQVHLEVDPTQYESEESKYSVLKESNPVRLEILRDLLGSHLGLHCVGGAGKQIAFTPAYFLGRHELKLSLLSQLKDQMSDGTLKTTNLALKFCGKGETAPSPTASLLPVMVHLCPDNFSTVEYFENLKSDNIGRLVIYSSVMTNSQAVLGGIKLQHGIVVIPKYQTNGIGRTSNQWISPEGCAMFSVQLHIPISSPLGSRIPLVQHLVATAVVSAILSLTGYEVLDIGVKWPNDIYAYNSIKIGGLVVNSIMEPDMAICNVGCGINLDNSNPTTCINDIIKHYNENSSNKLQQLTYEKTLAVIFTEIEKIMDRVQNGDLQYLYDLYYKYWLHSNAEINLQDENLGQQTGIIHGIDDYGFLLVRYSNGKLVSVHPDGNSFDMLRGLIVPKMH